MTALAELAASRELLGNLTSRELRGKYKRSALGWAWSLINPLAMAAVFTVVFSVVFRAPTPVGDPSGLEFFPLYLLCALLPWTFVSNGISGSMTALTSNANLVKKVYFPREVLVVATVLAWVVSLLIELSVLALATTALDWRGLLYLPLVPVVVAVQALFVVGLGLALSVLNVYFRDVQHFVSIFLQVWFYGTPVVYAFGFVQDAVERLDLPSWLLVVYQANPVVGFVQTYRALLYDHRLPELSEVAWPLVAAVGTAYLGLRVFRHYEPRLAEEL